jgi:SAM-dependent methyltransferase
MSDNDYNSYVKAEWDLFEGDPIRTHASLAAADGIAVTRVLDVGCGAGQEMLPFVSRMDATGVGVDIAPEVGKVGRDLFAAKNCSDRVVFMRAAAESLPFCSAVFDVVICRIALPYTDNRRALDEMARVLRKEGVLLLKIHHAVFYLRDLKNALSSFKVLSAVHAVRVLVAGSIYHVFGKQPRNRVVGNESYHTRWLLSRELKRRGLNIIGEMPDSNPATPSFIISNGNPIHA